MATDIDNLKEQAQNLNACLENLRHNMGKYPNQKEMRWMETMMESSLIALDSHIRELEKLTPKKQMSNKLFKR